MKEFMTKVSDYISERRNDPERNGNLMIFCMLGVVALIIIILCLLLLWQRNGKEQEQEATAKTYKYIPETILAESPEDEELKQEYLTNIQYMGEKVADLLQSMMEVRKTLEETVSMQLEGNTVLQGQVDEITGDINTLVVRLQNTQNQLYDITDMVNVMNTQTIPIIQGQIEEIENQMNQAGTDISDIYAKLDKLETTDAGLKAKIEEIEGNLRVSVEQNMADVTNRFDSMDIRLEEVEIRIGELASQLLRYRYDEGSKTLYLFPNQ